MTRCQACSPSERAGIHVTLEKSPKGRFWVLLVLIPQCLAWGLPQSRSGVLLGEMPAGREWTIGGRRGWVRGEGDVKRHWVSRGANAAASPTWAWLAVRRLRVADCPWRQGWQWAPGWN